MDELDEDERSAETKRAMATRRSISLGRTRPRPSELLARKLQLANATSGGDHEQQHERESRARGPSGSPNVMDSNGGDSMFSSSAEAKLQSLSEQLRLHQRDSWQMDSSNGFEQASRSPQSSKSIDDIYILLAKKEKDLQLAAELGKVLLEKNDELSKANEKITEDYTHKLEILEQEKHKLKRKLDLLNGDYENRLMELQTDCNILKNQLEEQQQQAKKREKEQSKAIDDLAQQNQRLTSELLEATKSEELLSSQLEQMNDRFNVRMSNRQDHVAQLDALKEEIQIIGQRKQDLERRLKLANQEKAELSQTIEESGDRILLLENLLNEKESKLGDFCDELDELRKSGTWLSDELEAMIKLNERLANALEQSQTFSHETANLGPTELYGLSNSELKRGELLEELRELRLKSRSRAKASELMLIQRRKHSAADNSGQRHRRIRHKPASRKSRTHLSNDEDDGDGDDDDYAQEAQPDGYEELHLPAAGKRRLELRDDAIVQLYVMLRNFHSSLLHRKESLQQSQQTHLNHSPNSTDDSGISADDNDKTVIELAREQASDVAQWRRMLNTIKLLVDDLPCSTCHLMIGERAKYEQLTRLHSKLCEESKRKDDQLLALNVIKTEIEVKLAALEDRCAILTQDLDNCDKPKEELVRLAWKARDEAVERKNQAEILLAKTRIENMQISSQLMEVVQQKGELSKKLAQFEDDIHYITQDSVKAKFTWEEYAEKLKRSQANQLDSGPSLASATGSLKPLAQLLSFSMASSWTNSDAGDRNNHDSALKSSALAADTNDNGNGNGAANNNQNGTNLMRNFASNRFKLRFWQRSNSSDKSATGDNGHQEQQQPQSQQDQAAV